ncbi:MAG: S8 family serine peptidase [Candidatus Thermoplasmatota archaeon]|nr:S8 family serine peptidase [Candidatus Thermoplasmatota archaeon]
MRSGLAVIILIMTILAPAVSVAEPETAFGPTYFDRNSNGLDDRMEELLDKEKHVGVILVLSEKPVQRHFDEIEKLGLDIDHVYKYINAIRIDEVPATKAIGLTKIPDVKLVEWQAPVYPFLDTSVRAIKVRDSSEYSPVVWEDKEFYGEGINIAILDTGVDNEHETFDEFGDQGVRRFIAGIDCDGGCPTEDGNYQFTTEEDSNEDPDDFNGHGTHTASTALGMGGDDDADGDGEPDYIGVAPAARLIDVKVMADWGSGSSADINEAIEACIENVNTDWENDGEKNNGVHVMSMSLGTTGGSDGTDTQSLLVNQANAAGIVVAVAMGNDGEQEVPSPAAADWSVAVGAMDNEDNVDRDDDDLASYSNYGPRDDDNDDDRWDELKPSVVAPGSGITAALGHSNIPGFPSSASGWTSQDGTSMACPHVAGLAALILEADISLRPGDNSNGVRDRLQDYSETWEGGEYGGEPSEPGESDRYNYYYGYGYLDSYKNVDINQPDAFVSEMTTSPEEPVEGDTVVISVKIENNGTLDIDEAMIRLIVDEGEITNDELGSINADSHIIWTYDWEPEEGDYDVQAEVYDVSPAESNLGNNILETTVSVTAEGVDLAIIEVWTGDSDPIHNEHIAIYAKIKNQGTEKAEDFELRWYDDNDRFTTLNGEEIEIDEEVTISGEWIAKEGESELLARLDLIQPADQNSNNDAKAFTIDVGPPPEDPDFSPANLAVEGTLEEGQEVTINFEIMNLGKTDGEIEYILSIDDETVDSGDSEVNGESSEVVSYTWTASKGLHVVKVQLENSEPEESSVENNEVELDIEIEESSAKFELMTIAWTDPLFKDEETAIKVTVKNYGGKDGSVITTLYAADSMVDSKTTEIEAGVQKDVYFTWRPAMTGNIPLSVQTDYDEDILEKNAYVQEIETDNVGPVASGLISVNGIPSANSMIADANTGDIVSFSGTASYDSDGTISKYAWSIVRSKDNYEISKNQENFEYIFNEGGTYSVTLTVTDDEGDSNAWQGNVIVNEKTTVTSNGDGDDGDNTLLIGGGIAILGLLGGVLGLRYFGGEEEDDFFDFEDTGPVNLGCPSCGGMITITTDQRPIQVTCPMCQGQFVIRE